MVETSRSGGPWQAISREDIRTLSGRVDTLSLELTKLGTRFDAHQEVCDERTERLDDRLKDINQEIKNASSTVTAFVREGQQSAQVRSWRIIILLITALGAFAGHDIFHWP